MLAAAWAASPAQAQSACTAPLLGAIACTGGGAPATGAPVLNLPAVAGPVTATLGNGFVSPATVAITSVGSAANVILNPAGTAVIETAGQPGLALTSGGGIQARVTSIATSGNGAPGAVLRAADALVFTADDTVRTIGDDADGINAQGRSVTVAGNILRTGGARSDGAELVSTSGPIDLTENLIETNGSLSDAALLRAGGPVAVNAGVLRTSGSQALGLDIATNPGACVLLGNGGCSVTAAADQITTNGFGGIGALVTAAAPARVSVGVLQTGGDQAAGLSLVSDPAACATLGVGRCDRGFTVNQLTTSGSNAPGALVRGAGTTSANVDVLRTSGANAAGLDLASDPTACATLGAAACGTSFDVGQLTTSGAGATGVLVRAAGPTTGRVDTARTLGANAPGIDIGADPTACALVGRGACDVNLAANQVQTQGDGAAAVLVRAPGAILANLGTLQTGGNNAPGAALATDPTVCLVLGPGACGVTATTGPVTTGGNTSPGVDVDNGGSGPTTVNTGPVTTGGANSPGVDVAGGSGPTTVGTGNVTTGGADSPGVVAGGSGPITVTTGNVATGGDRSDGVNVAGGEGPISVTTGQVTTGGANSDGIDVRGTGPIMVAGTGGVTTRGPNSDGIHVVGADDPVMVAASGPIVVSGAGSDGIDASATGCTTVTVIASAPISAASGRGIAAASACAVVVTTNAGAPVQGGSAGIETTSGTGSTVTIGDTLSATGGPALNADGGPATVVIGPAGAVTGIIDLTNGNDRLTNNGTFTATGSSSFGGGTDTLVNTGTLNVRPAAAAGAVTFAGLEATTNSGLIDLRNGAAGTTLTLPGSYVGTGNAALGVDVAIAPSGATADRLIVTGAATGSTRILVTSLTPNAGTLVNGLVVVDAGAGSSADAFVLAGGAQTAGFVTYRLAYDAAAADFSLFGTPNTSAYELVKIGEGARQLSYQMADAWSGHMQALRDGGGAPGADDPRKRGRALWGQAFGAVVRDRSVQATSVFGQSQTQVLTNRQDFFGGQIGLDLGDVGGGDGFVFGPTAGYGNSWLNFRATPDRIHYDAVNVGGYFGWRRGALFLNGLARYEHYWIRLLTPSVGTAQKLDGDGFGGTLEAGARLRSGGFLAEPIVAVDYSRSSIDDVAGPGSSFDLARAEGLRGRAGARLALAVGGSGPAVTSLYVGGQAVREFGGRKGLTFANGGQSLRFANDRIGTYGHLTAGVSVVTPGRVSGFVEGFGDVGDDRKGLGGRAGISVRM